MPLFEFEAGRLVPAQAGHTIDGPVEEAVLDAVRDQLLELVGVTVLPVAWQPDGAARQLTAMAPDGRAVSLEVVDRLDARTLVDALARLGHLTTTPWSELAESYPHGPQAFGRDWEEFRHSQPPHQPPTARLHIVAAHLDDDVRPAVVALADSGVVVHQLSARVMSSGRLFLEVTRVRSLAPRLPWLEPGQARTGLPARPQPGPAAGPVAAADPAPAGRAVPVADPAPAGDLRAIGQSLTAAASLVWAVDGTRHEARLTPEGWIELADERTFGDPGLAAVALGVDRDADAWSGWRFGEHGPSLHDARTELRAHRARRPQTASRGTGLSRRSRRRREAIE